MALATGTRRRLEWVDIEDRSAWLAAAALVAALGTAALFFYTRGGHLSFYVDE
jgi:hypothetical protein